MKENLDTKKKNELESIKPLLAYLNISLDQVICQERPDFVISLNDKKIGLELVSICPSTKFCKGKENASIAAISHKKRLEAKEKYKEVLIKRNENIVIDINFKPSAFWLTNDRKHFADKVIEEIEHLRNTYHDKFISCQEILSDENVNTSYIESIQLICSNMIEPLVVSIQGQPIQRITQLDFEKGIESKIDKLIKYKEVNINIEEFWLAVIVHHDEPYEYWEVPYMLPNNIGYQRIFLIQYGDVKELYK